MTISELLKDNLGPVRNQSDTQLTTPAGKGVLTPLDMRRTRKKEM
jgi:hypothetical protein